ncbi:putative acetyl-CoA transporter [Tieghemostelium lacteum]|uniref:Putative acetyl-CoA transporter n=1 Tax=Tieghemostelium lacteum TaxID=361077 RepID=A0A151Z8Z8_TIELA|nr:putative acetyl-CoA transporter [Tieghemostelium lacteum]|eukprot:KYQ90428.1 putative acetyl-CoA transporter [Tieghemostelium lacteum]
MMINRLKNQYGDDFYNIIWLISLYLIQGVPLGIVFGTIPFLLHKYASYTQIGIFYCCTYPYSLKLLWSPIVDSYYHRDFGRRKSWIVPIQIIAGIMLIILSYFVDNLIENSVDSIGTITIIFFTMIFFMATQDIAVDGWALTILDKKHLHLASTCQTIGLNLGYFLSYTIFLALSSPTFSNRYLRIEPQDEGIITLSGYIYFWGFVFIIVSLYLAKFKSEHHQNNSTQSVITKESEDHQQKQVEVEEEEVEDIDKLTPTQVYKLLWKIIKLAHIKKMTLFFIISKIVFQVNESALSLKLIDRGLDKEYISSFSILQFPCLLVFSVIINKFIKDRPLSMWVFGYSLGVILVFCNMLSVYMFPIDHVGWGYYLLLCLLSISTSLTGSLLMISQTSYFLKISDKSIGGTYLTLCNTIANFAGTYPKIIILTLVDKLTTSKCIISLFDAEILELGDISKELCTEKGGQYLIENDGYYPVAILSFLYGIFMVAILYRYFIPLERIKIGNDMKK